MRLLRSERVFPLSICRYFQIPGNAFDLNGADDGPRMAGEATRLLAGVAFRSLALPPSSVCIGTCSSKPPIRLPNEGADDGAYEPDAIGLPVTCCCSRNIRPSAVLTNGVLA